MRIILCVTNDIATDRRVNRIANSLLKIPASVLVIGRNYTNSMQLPALEYQVHRMTLLFQRGFLFYATFNVKLFFHLLFRKVNVLVANDLDTLPAVFLASKIRRIPIVYDCHEYFTELPELVDRRLVKKIWEGIEALIMPGLRYGYTVSASIANEYNKKYGLNLQVVRNLPNRIIRLPEPPITLKQADKRIILYQGWLNRGRGLELAIRAMKFISNARMIIIGTGDLENELKDLVQSLDLIEKVLFTGRIPAEELNYYTIQADLGISLEEKLGLNYYYALPNKLFDYIQARVPVLVSNLPEMSGVVNHYQIGKICSTDDPYKLSLIFGEMLSEGENRKMWKANLEKAAEELCWENEESILIDVYSRALTSRSSR